MADDQGQDPLDQLKALKTSQSVTPDPLDALKALKAGNADPLAKWHAQFKSGELQRNNANAADVEQAQIPSYGEQVAGGIASLAKDIPGGEALQAGARSVVRRQPYRQALSDIQGAEEDAPDVVRKLNRLAGGTVAALATPGSPVQSGARFGTASGLLQSNPDANPLTKEGLDTRLTDAVKGGVIGGTVGKVADLGTTAIRGLAASSPAANVLQRTADRTAESGPLYEKFRDLGTLPNSPKLQALVGTGQGDGLPIIRRAIDAVKGESPTLAKLPDTDARVLDAVYKRVGNKAFSAAHGFESGEARTALLDALDEASGGQYSPAVGAYREGSQGIGAVQRGKMTLKNAASKGGGSAKADLNTSPESFSAWAQGASPAEQQAAAEGIAGQLGRQKTVRNLLAAPDLLRASGATPPNFLEALRGLGQTAGTP